MKFGLIPLTLAAIALFGETGNWETLMQEANRLRLEGQFAAARESYTAALEMAERSGAADSRWRSGSGGWDRSIPMWRSRSITWPRSIARSTAT